MTRRRLGQRGFSAIEFAFVAPLLVFIGLAAIEFGYQGAIKAALEIGARKASRLGSTGAIGCTSGTSGTMASDSARQAAIRDAVIYWGCDHSAGAQLLYDNNLTVTETAFAKASDLPSATNSDGVNGVSGPGASGRFVSYTFTYKQPSILTDLSGFAKRFFGSSPIPSLYVHTSTVVVKNEPF